MAENFDLVVRNGTIATASDIIHCDVGVRDGRIVAMAEDLGTGKRELDASGKLVLPGGVDSHCHIEQASSSGVMTADDFYTGTVSACFGGTTTVIPFAAQARGQSLREVVDAYHLCAGPKAVIDYAFHLIISDPTPEVMGQELPALIEDGITSFKVYMTYDALKLDDYQMMTVLEEARRLGALVMVHAENHDVIRWLADRLLEQGHRAPKYHAVAHARIAEGEATSRAIQLAKLIDAPLLIVHVSAQEATDAIRKAQTEGLKIYGETCPQYLFLTAQDLDRDGMDGAMFCCSPPPRDAQAQEAIWRGLKNGTFQVFSSDHAPYRFDETAKLKHGPNAHFKQIANGVPGLELRLPLLFSEGVKKGRITLNEFVALTAANAAKLYGLFPRKGTIAVGADADFAIWDPDREVTVTYDMLHDAVGYTPYEGRTITGWPELVVSRGRIVVEDGSLHAEMGSGVFLECEKPDSARPLQRLEPEIDPARNWGFRL
ncbi:dihydropyrimidinase [Hwanghaeella grinnelliae]|uniref:Dihydropyrimidinase n=1 Tax=Hwanghaeella grinnelliae TaxID=2500179 RepID=A0A3S2VNM2_9PROT|nr:dihydropyrimidinase [Hwanghaeella grinnelliae]RVU35183.1 dihydropyrimidinase [Hwanghaeella grinnelliae]